MQRQARQPHAPGAVHKLPHNLWVLLFFAALVAMLGGASRYDAIQIVPLRTLSAVFLIPAVLAMTKAKLAHEATLVWLFAVLVLLMAVQLVPLPPGIWHSLPIRDAISEMDSILGQSDQWRPLTLAPMRTWNALGSLIVPGVALLLAIGSGANSRTLLQILCGIGVLSAILGMLQVVFGQSSSLYLYALSNRDSAVGFLANENHSAIFAACTLLIIARLGIESFGRERRMIWPMVYFGAFLLVFFASLVIGSRAGLVATLGASLTAIFMVWIARQARSMNRRKLQAGISKRVLLIPVFMLALTIGAFIMLDRAPAFQDILSKDSLQDMRWKIFPVELMMLSKVWFFGTGFGSFEQVYQVFEPSELLMPLYVNQAHNDWLQLIIEGGVVAALLLASLLLWIGRAIHRLVGQVLTTMLVIFWLSIFLVISAASAIDYPLRTPLFQVFLVWLLVALSQDSRGVKDTLS